MKQREISLLCAALVLAMSLTGCSPDSNTYSQISAELARQTSAAGSSSFSSESGTVPLEENDLRGSFTIKTYWDEQIETYIQDFNDLHPNVSINLVSPGQEAIFSFDDYHTQTAVELMSGNSADIIETDGLNIFKLAKSGMLCDLYPFMDADPDFDKGDYYTNIFEAKEFDGKLYSMPCGFSYDMLYTSKPLLEKARIGLPGSLNYKQMMEILDIVREKTGESPRLMPGLTPYTFFYYEFPEYYDLKTQTAAFLTPKFIEYLRLTKKNIPISEENDLTRVVNDDSFLEKDYLFCKFDVTGKTDIYSFLYDLQNIESPVPMVSTSGKAYFRTMREYAIANTGSSPSRDLAWEFLKYYISEKEVPNSIDSDYAKKYVEKYNSFIPINKNNFLNDCKFSYQYYMPYMSEDVVWKQGDLDAAADEAIQLMHAWNQQRNREAAEGDIYGALCGDLNSYYYQDLLTAEETADKMQNRMTIFLKE